MYDGYPVSGVGDLVDTSRFASHEGHRRHVTDRYKSLHVTHAIARYTPFQVWRGLGKNVVEWTEKTTSRKAEFLAAGEACWVWSLTDALGLKAAALDSSEF